MANPLVLLLVTALMLLGGATSHAETVPGLHSARIPVADQSDATLAAAARAALSEVVVKVSGSTASLKLPDIAAALPKARSYAQQYAFGRDEQGGGMWVEFEFDPSFINGLINRAGAPMWVANRPAVLVWLAAEGPEGQYFVNAETHPDQVAALTTAFARRGVPLRLPQYDAADATAVTPADIWAGNDAALQAAAARYKAQYVVFGTMSPTETEQFGGSWVYLASEPRDPPAQSGQLAPDADPDTHNAVSAAGEPDLQASAAPSGMRADRQVAGADLEGFMRAGADLAADELAARFAVTPTAQSAGATVRIAVHGITSFNDYATLVNWLEDLEVVKQAVAARVAGDLLELQLDTRADAAQLATLIGLNNRLQPAVAVESDAALNYQWQP